MSRLHPNEFISFAPKNKGEQVHVNHEGCPAGIDNKRRLYVKRSEDGTVVAYCHHCNQSGSSSDSVRTGSTSGTLDAVLAGTGRGRGLASQRTTGYQGSYGRGSQGTKVVAQRASPTSGALFNPRDWPVAAQVWLNKYGIDQSKWRWYYEPRLGRLCYTLRDTDNNPVFKCCRGIEQTNPKYLNFKQESDNSRQFLGTEGEWLVITEDIVSAQRCVDAGYAAFPMLTTVVTDKDLLHLTDRFSCVILMLDNDNIDVDTKRNKLKTKLELLGCKVISLSDTTDPKNYTHTELLNLLTEITQ